MTIKRGLSTDAQLVATSAAAVHTQAANTRSVITAISMYANTAVTDAVVHLVPSGGSASDTNLVFQRDFALDETYTAPELIGQGIEAGGTLQAGDGSGSGTELNIIITRTDFSGTSV